MARNKHLDCHIFFAVRFFLLINSFMSVIYTHYRSTGALTKKNCYASSFAVSGAIMWNDLPPQLRTITCLNSFKRELRKTFVPINVHA